MWRKQQRSRNNYEQDGEVWRRSWGLTAPARDSKQQRVEHERAHMLVRAWCPCCVKPGGRKSGAHKKNKNKDEEA